MPSEVIIFDHMRKVVFLDRDGVINYDPGDYTKSADDFQILPDVHKTLHRLNELEFDLIVITNQGGIAKGLYSLQDFYKIDQKMHASFKEHNVQVLETFFCPHHPDFGRCLCRKPNSLLVQKAIGKYEVSVEKSVLIGDKERDVKCAEGAGVRGVQIPTNAPLGNYLQLLTN